MDGQPTPTDTILVSGSGIDYLMIDGTYTLYSGTIGTTSAVYHKGMQILAYGNIVGLENKWCIETYDLAPTPGEFVYTAYYTSDNILGPYTSESSSYDPPPTVTYI